MTIPLIHTTTDYSKFKFILGNRNLNQNKISRIISDINNGLNLLPYCPILVYLENEEYLIIDGQHRFEVSKMIKSPVYFIETNEIKLRQIATINSRQDKWTQMDFLRCWINIGIKDYTVLKNIMKEYSIGISTTSSLLMTNTISGRSYVKSKFEDGLFEVKFLNETKDLFILSHSLFDAYKFYTDRNLISAVQMLKKKGLCDFEILKQKLDSAPMLMDKQGTPKDYIYNIEKVYNYRNNQRKIIF